MRDVTERKRLEQQLIQSEKLAATARMAATVAHEINNPLDAVLNLLYLARTVEYTSDFLQGSSPTEQEDATAIGSDTQ